MRLIDADALISEIKKDTKKAIEQDDIVGSFWLGYIAGLVIKQPTAQPSTSDLISRQAAIDAVEKNACNTQRIMDAVNNLPPAQPEPTDIDAKEAVYNLAEKIGIHQLFALTVELRGEPIQPELTYEQVEEYCKKRCLHVVTADFFESTKPQRLGHWIKHIDPFDGEQYECSLCGVLWEFNDGTPEDNEAYFCPNCGARMKGERQK